MVQKTSRFALSILCTNIWNTSGALYIPEAEEYNTQRVQGTFEIQFSAHAPWLSKPNGSLGLSQFC